MSIISPSVPSNGLGIADTIVRARNGTTTTYRRGEVGAFDFRQTAVGGNVAYAATNSNLNDPDSCFCVVQAAPSGVYGIFGVWLEDVPSGQFGKFMLRGICDVYAFATGGTIAGVQVGESLGVATTYRGLRAPGGPGLSCVGIALTATTTSAIDIFSFEIIKVLFNGVEGFNETGGSI
jgi:hypothetical protein